MNLRRSERDLARALADLTAEYKTQASEQARNQKQTLRWTKFSFFALLASTIAALFLWLTAKSANELNAESGRAWIGPFTATFDAPITTGNGLKIKIVYVNTGHEPGLDLVIQTVPILFTTVDWNTERELPLVGKFSRDCFNFSGLPLRTRVALPSSMPNGYNINVDTLRDRLGGGGGIRATPELVAGTQILALLQCYLYRSDGRIRHTSACFWFQQGKMSSLSFAICPGGNDAD